MSEKDRTNTMTDKAPDNNVTLVLYISTKCDLCCKHCFGNHGPDGVNARLEDLCRMASHFPQDKTYDIEITGGEPFCNKKVMYEFLEYIQALNPPNLRECSVDTNGLWIRDEASVKKVFGELRDRGVKCVGFLSDDKYHWEAGLDRTKLFMAQRIAEEYFGDEKFIFIADNFEKAVPMGRAKTMVPSDEWDWESECYVKLCDFDKKGSMIYIEPDGTTHVCQSSIFPVTSNILDHSYEDIAEQFRSNVLFQTMSGAGPQGIAELLGIKPEVAQKRIKKLGECVYCELLHKVYASAIAEIECSDIKKGAL